jgi:hypothetical protein
MADAGGKRAPRMEVYTHEEVDEILKRALERQQASASGVRRDELVDAAGEVGIDAADVDAAIREVEAERRVDKKAVVDVSADRKRELFAFYRHLGIYLVVNAALFLMDMVSTGGHWFYWPLIGWGIGVGAHAVNVLFPKETKHERRARQQKRGARDFELAVERGVEKILSRTDAKRRVELPAAPKRVARDDDHDDDHDDEADNEAAPSDATPERRARR